MDHISLFTMSPLPPQSLGLFALSHSKQIILVFFFFPFLILNYCFIYICCWLHIVEGRKEFVKWNVNNKYECRLASIRLTGQSLSFSLLHTCAHTYTGINTGPIKLDQTPIFFSEVFFLSFFFSVAQWIFLIMYTLEHFWH